MDTYREPVNTERSEIRRATFTQHRLYYITRKFIQINVREPGANRRYIKRRSRPLGRVGNLPAPM